MWTEKELLKVREILEENKRRELFRKCTDKELSDFKSTLPENEVQLFDEYIAEIKSEYEMLLRLAEDTEREQVQKKIAYKKKMASCKRYQIMKSLKSLIKQCDV